jgi:hypothetical protein
MERPVGFSAGQLGGRFGPGDEIAIKYQVGEVGRTEIK